MHQPTKKSASKYINTTLHCFPLWRQCIHFKPIMKYMQVQKFVLDPNENGPMPLFAPLLAKESSTGKQVNI